MEKEFDSPKFWMRQVDASRKNPYFQACVCTKTKSNEIKLKQKDDLYSQSGNAHIVVAALLRNPVFCHPACSE